MRFALSIKTCPVGSTGWVALLAALLVGGWAPSAAASAPAAMPLPPEITNPAPHSPLADPCANRNHPDPSRSPSASKCPENVLDRGLQPDLRAPSPGILLPDSLVAPEPRRPPRWPMHL